jgi:tRNA G18 (ribose-2'-O)-methylase SpoU
MTARPPEVALRLLAQERRVRGAEGGRVVPRLPLAVLVDNVRSLWNVGSIFRTADACGVREIVLSGITGCPPRAQIAKTALGAEGAVAWRYRADPRQALQELVDAGYAPVALETTDRAVSLDRLDWPPAVCLIVGNEVAGVGADLLEACPRHVAIPMRGVKGSLNVAVAFGIVAYDAGRALARVAEPDPRRRPA